MPVLLEDVTMDIARARLILHVDGWSILEQRFPRRAYVVIREPFAVQTTSFQLPPWYER